MGLVDISEVTPQFFILAAFFILLIGSSFSFGILRLFQKRKQQGFLSLGVAVVAFIVMLITFF
ncbi:hypothetical protein SY83_19760 [Paenibacillus swuensis]|uniref:Uncharacterized protein n=1 Tax=Paenibacillus swuensis TaxID=1178515 RepID=A0A172TMN8_9BACL|nr:hypothetical protein [Paenibacillus swuensis]ANE48154.1 hypothetical protein SY83_19760 [Paenibacillus swuensis]